jgi:hypothetical protein
MLTACLAYISAEKTLVVDVGEAVSWFEKEGVEVDVEVGSLLYCHVRRDRFLSWVVISFFDK